MKLPRSYGSRVYLAHLVLVGLGLIFLLVGWWRTGVFLIGITFGLAAVARVFITEDHVGMLGVRGRVLDVIRMGTPGTARSALGWSSCWPTGPPNFSEMFPVRSKSKK